MLTTTASVGIVVICAAIVGSVWKSSGTDSPEFWLSVVGLGLAFSGFVLKLQGL